MIRAWGQGDETRGAMDDLRVGLEKRKGEMPFHSIHAMPCHVHVHAMSMFMPCPCSCHVLVHAMSLFMPCPCSCHVIVHAMSLFMPCPCSCHVHAMPFIPREAKPGQSTSRHSIPCHHPCHAMLIHPIQFHPSIIVLCCIYY